MTLLPIAIGGSGWVRFTDSDGDATYVRAQPVDDSGRLVVTELYMERQHGFTASEKSGTSIAEFEAELNRSDNAAEVRSSLETPGPALSTAVEYFAHRWGADAAGTPKRPHWAADMYWSQIPESGVPEAPRPRPAVSELPRTERINLIELATVEVPPGRTRPDSFYLEVVERQEQLRRYTDRSAAGLIARANDVPTTTVDRWIRRGRQIRERES